MHLDRKGAKFKTPRKKMLKYQFIPKSDFFILSQHYTGKIPVKCKPQKRNTFVSHGHGHYAAKMNHDWLYNLAVICVLVR